MPAAKGSALRCDGRHSFASMPPLRTPPGPATKQRILVRVKDKYNTEFG